MPLIENSTLRSLVSGVRRIELGDAGFTVTRSNGAARFHPFASLSASLSVSNGILGASLRIGGEVILKRIRRDDLAALVQAYETGRRSYWKAQAVLALKQVEQGSGVFQRYVARPGYLRTSVLCQMERELRKYQPALQVVQVCTALGLKVPEQADGLGIFLDDPDGWRQRFNADWAREQEHRFAPFFDTLEKHPLTPAQRRACVVDEDNVLVLAGAGTGKTSTMMAKAAYLVRSPLYCDGARLRLSGGGRRLGEPAGSLHRVSITMEADFWSRRWRKPWPNMASRRFSTRIRAANYRRVHRRADEERHRDQHGRRGVVARQCVRRTAVAQRQIRGGLSARLRRRHGGARFARPLSGVLQRAAHIRALTGARRTRLTSARRSSRRSHERRDDFDAALVGLRPPDAASKS